MDQEILNIAVRIATQKALEGRPVACIVWYPPTSASSDPKGIFDVYERPLLGSAADSCS